MFGPRNLLRIIGRNLIFLTQPAAQVDQFAPFAAKRMELLALPELALVNRLFADRAQHNWHGPGYLPAPVAAGAGLLAGLGASAAVVLLSPDDTVFAVAAAGLAAVSAVELEPLPLSFLAAVL
jgi:hypothetical protein